MISNNLTILLTNDDGFDAPGIKLLEKVCQVLGFDIWIVAPARNQSGRSASLARGSSLGLKQIDEQHFTVDGTPVDCVFTALSRVLPKKPNYILSGINLEANLGALSVFSGTLGATLIGCLFDIPSFALSQAAHNTKAVKWKISFFYLPNLLSQLFPLFYKKGNCFNINFPDCPPDEVKGVKFTKQGIQYYNYNEIDKNAPILKILSKTPHEEKEIIDSFYTETYAVNHHFISVSPLSLDRADDEFLSKIQSINLPNF